MDPQNKKILYAVGGLAVVAALAIGTTMYVRGQDAGAERKVIEERKEEKREQAASAWKTHTSVGGVSFEYPPGWVVKDEMSAEYGAITIATSSLVRNGETVLGTVMQIYHQDPVMENYSLADIKAEMDSIAILADAGIQISYASLAGHDAVRVLTSESEIYIVQVSDTSYYTVGILSSEPQVPQLLSTLTIQP